VKTWLTTAAVSAGLLVGGLVGGLVGAAPAAGAHRAAALTDKAKVVLPHYKIRVIGVDNDSSTSQAIVSANGRYLVNNYVDGIEYDTATGKRIGEVETDNPESNGVANNGTIVGEATHNLVETAFAWHAGHYTYFPATAAVPNALGCANPTDLESGFEAVSPAGVAIGSEYWSCGSGLTSAAVTHPDASGAFSITGQHGSNPAGQGFIDDGTLAVGYPAGDENDNQVMWNPATNSAPVNVRVATGFPSLYPYQAARYWNSSGEFLATGADTSGTVELIAGKHAYDIVTSPTHQFQGNALGNNGIVVGSDGGETAEVWSPSIGIRSLKSLSSATSESLLRALAVDSAGNIYGVGQDKKFDVDYWEAQLVHPAPTVSIKTPKSGKHYRKGAKLTASYTCKAGAGSTLKSCKGSVADHHKVSTKKTGKHAFTVMATDADGVTTRKTVHYAVKK
jgi:hypothetical protein